MIGFFIMIDTRVNSDLAETKIVTFALKIINSKSVSKTTFTRGEFIRVNVERNKNLLLNINTEKRVDKVLPGKIFIMISFKEKFLLM